MLISKRVISQSAGEPEKTSFQRQADPNKLKITGLESKHPFKNHH